MVCLSIAYWFQMIRTELERDPSRDQNNNVRFICANNEKVFWKGLAIIAALSDVFQARSGEEQNFTVMVPDYEAKVVRKLLAFLTNGSVVVGGQDSARVIQLAKDLKVRRKIVIFYYNVIDSNSMTETCLINIAF